MKKFSVVIKFDLVDMTFGLSDARIDDLRDDVTREAHDLREALSLQNHIATTFPEISVEEVS